MSKNNNKPASGNKNVVDFSDEREKIIKMLNDSNSVIDGYENLTNESKHEVGGIVAVTSGTFTGEIKVTDANPKTGIRGFVAAMTDKGEAISLQSLMGVKSFDDFKAGDFQNEFANGEETSSETVKGAYDKGFTENSLKNRWIPKYWDLYDEAAYLMATGELKGKTFKRMAVLYKEFTARKQFTMSGQTIKPGHKRYIKATAWQVG